MFSVHDMILFLLKAAVLRSGETLEALQSCLDPSILSIFEDTPTIEVRLISHESEATLLTALTDILDNVDDENLSPFDTLPDSDLLSGQKGREHSPLRRLLCLSRSPPEKDSLCNTRPASAGKVGLEIINIFVFISVCTQSLPRIQADCLQRSDGEEEDDGSLTLSPVRQESSLESNLLDWECPTLPLSVTFEQEGEDGVSVSLGDLVRHMHPYCMAICVENDDGEQMLPEGGILLEVVDQGENGEPILAIPSMALPAPPALEGPSSENEQKLAEEAASDSSEHIVVDDDVMVSEAPVKGTGPVTQDQHSDVKEETIKQQNEDIKEKSSSGRKIKKKCKEKCQPKPVEGRVLRSGTVRKMAQEEPIQPGKRSIKDKKKYKVPKAPVALSPASSVKPKKLDPCQTETKTGNTTTTLLPKMNEVATHASPTQDTLLSKDGLEMSESVISPTSVTSEQPNTPETPSSAPKKMENSSAAPPAVIAPMSSEIPAAAPSPTRPQMIPPVCEALPTATIAVPELKPKSLSLEEYRRLRQQKKPVQVEKRDNNSIKWPSLPELPKELPPIPCLPDPSPKDSRRPIPQVAKNEVEEVKPAWRPRGPTAPPTPECTLFPFGPALTPPATPPHQMWKPLAPVALLGKSKATGTSKSTPSKVIKIEARPLPSVKSRSKPTPATAAVDPNVACIDHDYCLPNKGTHTAEPGKRWNVKQQSFITIKPIKQPATGITQKPSAVLVSMNQTTTNPALTKKTRGFPHTVPLDHRTDSMETGSVLETPDASPERQETNSTVKERSHSRGPLRRPYHHLTASHTSSSGTSPKERNGGRSRKRRSHRSPSPLSSSSESDSSRSRSRSRPPSNKRFGTLSKPPLSLMQLLRDIVALNQLMYSLSPPQEERRVVYVGRIRATMTQKELKERFSLFGEIEDCTLHFRDHGDNYGFVTYYDTKDAFTAIENGSKLRKPDELPFDLCFGGRRQFCQTSYSDLDSNREYDPLPVKGNFHALDFDTLLKQAQQNMKR
uniref:PPARG related coactivator 1 n=1 Tax=Echeneis naucrates TaxID=173247 RepID=A0A665UYL2_ECHNA